MAFSFSPLGPFFINIPVHATNHKRNSPIRNEETTPINASSTEVLEDIPPSGGYGWVCAFCVILVNVHTWGISSTWGVILDYFLSNSTFPNGTHLNYAFMGGLSIATSLFLGLVVMKTYKTIGTTTTLLLSTLLNSGVPFAASDKIWHLHFTQVVVNGFGLGFVYLTAMSVLLQRFSSRRSFAVGLAATGSGIGGLAYNPGVGHIIQTLGFRETYRMLSYCNLVADLVSALLLKDRKQSQSRRVPRTFDYRSISQIDSLLLGFWGVTTEIGYITYDTCFLTMPHPSALLHNGTRSVAGASLSLGLIIGRPIVGYPSGSFGRITNPMLMTGLCGTYALLLAFAILVGTVYGTFWGPMTPSDDGGGRSQSSTIHICANLPYALYVGSIIPGALSLWVLRVWKLYDIEKTSKEVCNNMSAFPSYFAWIRPRKLFLTGCE
ncbi:major facilitator superfamily domain-containing protein [Aspergillus alliaceus]|uniref:major facilitator superfamily domain-containing protein n=1 Tax=Petromyces alliaceus TaxID=209559 RepID=UPI0012A76794|nr:major facilitator superfamily domain-containing protein [Aspergillus alliaceus]KAB8237213.1 major facilitator superfamily domain-containing protein [Aspergillus alliaceus]